VALPRRPARLNDRLAAAGRLSVIPAQAGIQAVWSRTAECPRHPHSIAAILHPCDGAEMKATLTVGRRGTVTLPAKFRQALGIKADDQLIAETTPDGLLLRPAVTLPVEIYSEKRIREFDAAEAELAEVLRRKPKRKVAR